MNSKDVTQTKEFKIVRQIGQGSCGKVFELANGKGGTFAFKASEVSRADLVFLLRTELAKMNTISTLHANVVAPLFSHTLKIKAEDRSDTVLEGIVMHHYLGGTLDEALDNARVAKNEDVVPFSLRYSLIRDISAGLAHLHANGLVHCDVKADNVFLDGELIRGVMAIIGDLGMACTEGTAVKRLWGCETHCAPELCGTATANVVHFNSDSYSLGVLMAYIALDDAINPFLSIDQDSEVPIVEQKAGALEEALEILEEEMQDDRLWVDIIRNLTAFCPHERMSITEVHRIACQLLRAVEDTEGSDEDNSTDSEDWCDPGSDVVLESNQFPRQSTLRNTSETPSLGLSDWPLEGNDWDVPDSKPSLLSQEPTTPEPCFIDGHDEPYNNAKFKQPSLLLDELLVDRRLSTESHHRCLSRQISARASGCGTNSRRASVCKSTYSKGKGVQCENKVPCLVKNKGTGSRMHMPPARWVAGRRRNHRVRKGHWCKARPGTSRA